MIYFTTLILTLILSHIARATPACGDVARPEELYDEPTYADYEEPTYADYADDQQALPIILHNVTWSSFYDNKHGDTHKVVCKGLAHHYPHFGKIPHFPNIGGAYNVHPGTHHCGSCWSLTDLKTKKSVRITVINSAKHGTYNISKEAFHKLGGKKGVHWLQAEAKLVSKKPCGVL